MGLTLTKRFVTKDMPDAHRAMLERARARQRAIRKQLKDVIHDSETMKEYAFALKYRGGE